MKTVAVIPAHLASVRFPEKILFDIHGLPMIEHVRRRALLANSLTEVYVATCDYRIAEVVTSYGGNVIMTNNLHKNGTTRVAEAIADVDCTHVVLLQGDEPLLLPRHIDSVIKIIRTNPSGDAWNATGKIETSKELDLHSFVKCSVNDYGKILHCFRKTPYFSSLKVQQKFVRKILGIIAYRKDFIFNLVDYRESKIEIAEFIEQMRIIENDFNLISVPVEPSLPSVNEPHEVNIVLDYIMSNTEQQEILKTILL